MSFNTITRKCSKHIKWVVLRQASSSITAPNQPVPRFQSSSADMSQAGQQSDPVRKLQSKRKRSSPSKLGKNNRATQQLSRRGSRANGPRAAAQHRDAARWHALDFEMLPVAAEHRLGAAGVRGQPRALCARSPVRQSVKRCGVPAARQQNISPEWANPANTLHNSRCCFRTAVQNHGWYARRAAAASQQTQFGSQ